MTTKHTPGPWSVSGETTIKGPKGNTIAEVFGYSDRAMGSQTLLPYGGRESNARLIAAAPELLEAVEALLLWIAVCDHGSEYKANMHKPVVVKMAKDALKSARSLDAVAARIAAMAEKEPAQ